jgi:hypothetical protein
VSRAGVVEAVQAAVRTSEVADEWARCPSAVVRLFGAAAGVAYRPDPAEIARRAVVGLGAISQRDVLDVLMGLPAGLPVAAGSLTTRDQRVLRRAPYGAVERHTDHLVRQAVPPVSARFAVVAARSWREGLVKAGRFAPFCARAILLPTPPVDLDDARMQASFYGIGLCVFIAGTLRMLVDPQPYIRQRHSSAQWWFTEELYRQLAESHVAVSRSAGA